MRAARKVPALLMVLMLSAMPAMAYKWQIDKEKQIEIQKGNVLNELMSRESAVINKIRIKNEVSIQQAKKLANILHEKSKKAIYESVKRLGNLITTKSTVQLGRDAVFYTSDFGDRSSSRWGAAPAWYGSQYYLSSNKVEAATLL